MPKRKFESTHKPVKRPHVNLTEENPCWFCLSSSKVEKHLIVAIGEYLYLSLAKGGLVDEHFLIIPIEHIDSQASDKNSDGLNAELEQFKQSLKLYFRESSKGVIFFERNFRSVHWQLQAVPIDLNKTSPLDQCIKGISKRHFANSNYVDIPTTCKLNDVVSRGSPYLYWQVEPEGSRFVTEISTKGCYFPIQLGRCVLADSDLLDCLSKVDWKNCVKSLDEYRELVSDIKKRYKTFDFT